MQGSSGELMDKVKSLQMALIQKDGVISLLKIQIEQFEEQEVGLRERRVVGGKDMGSVSAWHIGKIGGRRLRRLSRVVAQRRGLEDGGVLLDCMQ